MVGDGWLRVVQRSYRHGTGTGVRVSPSMLQDGNVDDGLFEIEETKTETQVRPTPMTAVQREMIRELFAQIGVSDARAQFQLVAELTGVNIAAVTELEMEPANVLIRRLKSRISNSSRARTGNAWADREEDTWIDRL